MKSQRMQTTTWESHVWKSAVFGCRYSIVEKGKSISLHTALSIEQYWSLRPKLLDLFLSSEFPTYESDIPRKW